jgi:hypothetical protein
MSREYSGVKLASDLSEKCELHPLIYTLLGLKLVQDVGSRKKAES